ncbi:hypothetical protein NUW54_g9103 [Trametes sanguinea]|uniref:Uncharacterized protein n=1 Tax=Trametes sanguinea TaxID=158606 RepID=A0ACC1P9H1_9APHY|nr:hypothetical protein NUW54_g9103 [Trametes sanguinea]
MATRRVELDGCTGPADERVWAARLYSRAATAGPTKGPEKREWWERNGEEEWHEASTSNRWRKLYPPSHPSLYTSLDVELSALTTRVAHPIQSRKFRSSVPSIIESDSTERDRSSPRAMRWRSQGDACPWDENYVKKPAYQGIIDGFQTKH